MYFRKKHAMSTTNPKKEAIRYYFDFLWTMTEKEIKVRYKRAFFGFLWIIFNPLLQMLIIGTIFSYFIKIPNYFLFLFAGLLAWQFFSLSLTKATPSIVNERALIQKAKFPIELIPLSIILSNFFHTAVSFTLLLFVLLIFEKILLIKIIFFPLVLLWLLFLTAGISLLFSTLNVRFRDVNFFVQTLIVLWFYATPVIYSLKLVPAYFYPLFYLNPLTSIFELIHYLLIGNGEIDFNMLFINFGESILLIILGVIVYKKENKYFADWL